MSGIGSGVLGGGLIPGGRAYWQKLYSVETANLIGLWRQNETSGSTSVDWSPNEDDGDYTGVTLDNSTGPDGAPVPFYDGANDYNDIYAIASELLDNPGFETAGGGGADIWGDWTENAGDGALANEAANQHTGDDAAKVTAGSSADTYVDQNVTVTAGETYELRFWARGDGSDEGRYSVYDVDNSADIVATTGTGVTATSYAKVSAEFTAPAGCSTVRIRLQCSTTDTAECYFDSCSVRDVTRFDGQEGTALVWAKVNGAGVWTDSEWRVCLSIRADTENILHIRKSEKDNTFQAYYKANNIAVTAQVVDNPTDWMAAAVTFSASSGIIRLYVGGVLVSDNSGVGTWVGNPGASTTVIGAGDTATPDYPWHGWIGPVAIWNTPLTAAQIAYVSSV